MVMKSFYRLIWRWHFFCGLLLLPFILLLAITGAIYLFDKEYEDFAYADLLTVTTDPTLQPALSASRQLAVAKAAYPERIVALYITASTAQHSTEIILKKKSKNKTTAAVKTANSSWDSRNDDAPEKISVFINPYTGKIIGELDNNKRFMTLIKDLHGELLTGKIGTTLVEFAASWTIVLIITGLFLWWPKTKSLKGVLIPRFTNNKRLFWRDLHAVPAFYSSFLILFLLFTGLIWTDIWGSGFKYVQRAAGQSAPSSFFDFNIHSKYQENMSPISLDQVVRLAREKGLQGQLKIRLPLGKKGAYNLIKEADDPAKRIVLQVDQYSAEVIQLIRWQDNPSLEKAVAIGIKLHRGDYFGLANQLLGLLTALALVVISITAVIMWWRRKPKGSLGIPQKTMLDDMPVWFVPVMLFFVIFLPLLGLSLLIFALFEKIKQRFVRLRSH